MKTPGLSSPFALGVFAVAVVMPLGAQAAKVISAGALDKDYVVVQISDGDVAHEVPGEKSHALHARAEHHRRRGDGQLDHQVVARRELRHGRQEPHRLLAQEEA
jgi:hypothetical protein